MNDKDAAGLRYKPHCLGPINTYCHPSWSDDQLHRASVVRRLNRFALQVRMENELASVYLPNSGRLEQLIFPGNEIIVAHRSSAGRKTDFDAVMASVPGREAWACIDSRLPARIIGNALKREVFPEFAGLTRVRPEVTAGSSRLDYRLSSGDGGRTCWLEVKSVTLTADSEARFPDAPTDRGRRHLEKLAQLVSRGFRCAVVFAVCRPEARTFAPNCDVDINFSRALWKAAVQGVEVYSYRFLSNPQTGTRIAARLPVFVSNY